MLEAAVAFISIAFNGARIHASSEQKRRRALLTKLQDVYESVPVSSQQLSMHSSSLKLSTHYYRRKVFELHYLTE